MLGLNVKRGIEATCERVFIASGNKFSNLKVLWGNGTACINYTKGSDGVRATIVLPNIDETKVVPQSQFNNTIAFVLHELGHAWFTRNEPWDKAVTEHKAGKYIGSLINGLEDPRIEQRVIDSGYAPNSFPLFDALINSLLREKGYVDEINKQTLPFVLCVEGRRLNGYSIDVPDLITGHDFEKEIRFALETAKLATSTDAIVAIAKDLYAKLFPEVEVEEQPPEQPEEFVPVDDGDEGDGDGDGDGDETDDKPTDDKPKKSSKPSKGKPSDGKELKDDGGDVREVEPNDFIKRTLESFKCKADRTDHDSRPTVKSVEVITLDQDWS